MEIQHLNEDCGSPDLTPTNTVRVATWYESAPYEGSGTAWAQTADGCYWVSNLGHCSCYGPWESGYSGNTSTAWDGPYTSTEMDMQLLGNSAEQIGFRKFFGFSDINP